MKHILKAPTDIVVGEALVRMVDYTKYHFNNEIDLFEKYGYPKAEEHKAEHDEFVENLTYFLKESKSGNLLLSLKTIDFLKDWMITHILGTDKEFADFIRAKELGNNL